MNLERLAYWIGAIDESHLEDVLEKIRDFIRTDPQAPTFLMLKSAGGEVESAFAFYDTIKLMKPNLVTIGTGNIDSSAPIVLAAGKLRFATPNTTFYLHTPAMMPQGEGRIEAKQFRAYAKDLDIGERRYAQILSEHSEGKLPLRKLRALMRRNAFLTAPQALALGLIDGIDDDGVFKIPNKN